MSMREGRAHKTNRHFHAVKGKKKDLAVGKVK